MRMLPGFSSLLAAVFLLAATGGCAAIAEKPMKNAVFRLDADGPGETYELIQRGLGNGTIEAPDQTHPAFGRHITEEYDAALKKNVLAFHIHQAEDGDRAERKDRQRNEIKVFDGSPDGLKGFHGTTFVYEWRFFLDPGLKVTGMWTHFFQLKPVGGPDEEMPIITISAAAKHPGEKIEIRYCSGKTGGDKYAYVARADLAQATGVWLSAKCLVTYGEKGVIGMTVSKPDGTVVLEYHATDLSLWRKDCQFVRPKWGIYRGLAEGLRDEKVLFADFSITKEAVDSGGTPGSK
jgi:hypothetical protein